MRSALTLLAAACVAIPGAASAVVLPVELTMTSGASFSGTITMDDGLTQILTASGTLYGYTYGNGGPFPGGTDIYSQALLTPAWDRSGAANVFVGYIGNGVDGGRGTTNQIRLIMDISNLAAPSLLALDPSRPWVRTGVASSSDGITGGSVSIAAAASAVGAVPEPSSWLLFILGFGALGAALRRQRGMGRQRLRLSYG